MINGSNNNSELLTQLTVSVFLHLNFVTFSGIHSPKPFVKKGKDVGPSLVTLVLQLLWGFKGIRAYKENWKPYMCLNNKSQASTVEQGNSRRILDVGE